MEPWRWCQRLGLQIDLGRRREWRTWSLLKTRLLLRLETRMADAKDVEQFELSDAGAADHGPVELGVLHCELDCIANVVAQRGGQWGVALKVAEKRVEVLLLKNVEPIAVGAEGEKGHVSALAGR